MSKDILNQFGMLLMERVRDWPIAIMDRLVNGKSRAREDKELGKYFKTFPPEVKKAFEELIPITVDITIHHFLWLIEENPDLDLIIKTNNGIYSLKNVSDGLSGEIYTYKGWIVRYSKERWRDEQVFY